MTTALSDKARMCLCYCVVNTKTENGAPLTMDQINFNSTNVPIRTAFMRACDCGNAPKAYVGSYLDTNNNNRFDPTTDSVILSDTNNDGKYDYRDAEQTSKLLNLMQNRRDPNLDNSRGTWWNLGQTSSDWERKEGNRLIPQLNKLDPNQDGVIQGTELGTCPKVFQLARDQNGDGQFTGTDFHTSQINITQITQGHTAVVSPQTSILGTRLATPVSPEPWDRARSQFNTVR